MWNNIKYFIREGLSNMFTHGFMSFAAVGTTVACLLIMGTFTLVAVNANQLLAELERENQILCFVDEELSDSQAKALGEQIKAMDNVTEITFISRKEAMDAFVSKYEDEALYKDVDVQVFRHRYAVNIEDITRLSETAEALENVEGVADVNAYEAVSNGFIALRNVAGIVCLALIAILLVVSIFIISNTIKLTYFDRREEIAIMKMVGATNSFIRWPFVCEGMFLGLLGAGISFGLQWLLYSRVAISVAQSDTAQLLRIIPFEQMWQPVAVVFVAAGLVIGVGGSLSAIRKFLQV